MGIKRIILISLALILVFTIDFSVNKKRPINSIIFIVLMQSYDLDKPDFKGVAFAGNWKPPKPKENTKPRHLSKSNLEKAYEQKNSLEKIYKPGDLIDIFDSEGKKVKVQIVKKNKSGTYIIVKLPDESTKTISLDRDVVDMSNYKFDPDVLPTISYDSELLINNMDVTEVGFDPYDFGNYFPKEIDKRLKVKPIKILNYQLNPSQKYSKLLSSHFHLLLMFDRKLSDDELKILDDVSKNYLDMKNYNKSINLVRIAFND